MTIRPARAAGRLATAAGLLLASLAATAAPAQAAPQPMGRCTTTSGAVLAVDFSRWGGPVHRSCGTTPTTGYELLNQGGWRTTGTGHDGPAFICRIGYSGFRGGQQFPPPQQEDCVLTPPASAYWSYWHADPGANTWTYSRLGAMLYKPKPGSVDLWIFGGTDTEGTEGRPTVTPDQLRARNTRPTGAPGPAPKDTRTAAPVRPDTDTGPAPERPAPARPTTTAPRPPKPSPSPSPAQSKPKKPSPASASPADATGTPSPTASSRAPSAVAAPGSGTEIVDAAPAADADHDSGSSLPAVATGALVLTIGAAAAYAARRRKRTTG
ncbi:hypothetical protein [Streptomyces yaizuensis]|uniref:LPXTG cell wall anchor domain-containing protein n=1 Tax=Streptomyces yaizuensis TaxID=2989713 RepID=A0ABQ5NRS4_9ACTN|nr:hypothetical protein [Streptomyces sp. YSPA8]GLF93073.1 LPXTG cell wall anchor domain-containing protein [Streptomyces sp. YSPA8]